ncbi:hypothetical protein [Caballeronia sp. LZ035]|uniref:hypothetical protein n=1 Tax=Caballeronia sp. LZ035 TaxID=3038568 RepID=UPI0028594B60|nr:hypothetical protein [Caballeronia sp. LZ035]MDR5760146.1 hypothetical protein [Caballeronia sp. LZ035]
MAVSTVSSTSSASTQPYGGSDDDTAFASHDPANGSASASGDNPAGHASSGRTDGDDADDASSTQGNAPAGQSTSSQIPSSAPEGSSGDATQSLSSGNQANAPAGELTLPQPMSANTTTTNTTTFTTPPLANAEATQLLSRLDKDPSITNDAANANSMAALQRDSLRGADPEAIGFEQRTTQASQEVDALRADQRDYYRGALAAGSTYYNATTSDQRGQIASQVNTRIIDPIHTAYQQAMRDPNARVQMTFNKPFGSVYLGAGGQQQTDRLTRMGQQFNQAATPEERARIFGQAVDLRHAMQSQIGTFTDQERSRVQGQWQQADQEINQALRDATALRVADANSGFDNASSFQRLSSFITHGLNSERNAQEFQYRLTQTPDDFKALRDWSADATRKATWATSAIQSDPLRRTPELPPLPPDLTKTTTENARMGNFGGDMLYRYQTANHRILDAMDMYHAASQKGPIKYTYVDDHTPPLPLWQQQLKDGLGRFFVGMVPGVNLMTDYIVPAKSLPEWARQGIDFASGVVGSFVPAAKLPRFGSAGEMKPVGEFKPSTEFKPTNEFKPAEAPATSTPASKSTSGIPLVPKEYARPPAGKLVPDADARGLYRDETGQQYIQQGGKRYPVDWNEAADSWRMKPRDGSPNSPNMRLNEKGNWEVNLDTGLKGGAPGDEKYRVWGKAVYQAYTAGREISEISRVSGISPELLSDWIRTYASERGFPIPRPLRIRANDALRHMLADKAASTDASAARQAAARSATGTSGLVSEQGRAGPSSAFPDVSTSHSFPISEVQYRKILAWRTHNIPNAHISKATGIPEAWVERIQSLDGYWSPAQQRWVEYVDPIRYHEVQASAGRPRYSMTVQQHADIVDGLDQRKPAWQIGQEAGVPTDWVDRIQSGRGEYSRSAQAWIPDDEVRDPVEPPAKRQRTGVESGATGQSPPQTGATTQPEHAAHPESELSWGRRELTQYYEEHSKVSQADSDSIDAWLDGDAPAPLSLKTELAAQGYSEITPDMLRTYLVGGGPSLTEAEMQRIMQFFGS